MIATFSSLPLPGRRSRALILAVLLAGIVLSLVMAPAALEAQQAPPGQSQGGGGGGYGGGGGPMIPKGLFLAGQSSSSGWSWLWILVVVAILALLGALVYRIRGRASA